MQNVEWVMGEWVIPLRLLRLLEHLAVLKSTNKFFFKKYRRGQDDGDLSAGHTFIKPPGTNSQLVPALRSLPL